MKSGKQYTQKRQVVVEHRHVPFSGGPVCFFVQNNFFPSSAKLFETSRQISPHGIRLPQFIHLEIIR